MIEMKGNSSGHVVGRRGLVAAAWAAVIGLVLKRTERPVQAAAGLQFQDQASATNVPNQAGGSTSIQATTSYPTERAVFTAMAGSGTSRVACAGSLGGAFLIGTTPCGVLGYNFTGTAGAGVQGIDYYSTKAGVLGLSGGIGNGTGVGVQGESANGYGVQGVINPSGGFRGAIGVYGMNSSDYAGPAPGTGGFGVYGASLRGHGLVGATGTAGGAAVVGATNGVAGAYAGVFYGPVVVTGSFQVQGAKSAALPHPDGTHRLVYCVESPESWLEDLGTATLECGRAEVAIDEEFAAVAGLDGYHVFITPYDGLHSLTVSKRSASGFVVEADADLARLKGINPASLTGSFSWRVVAKRKDIDAKRLAPVTMPTAPTLPAPGATVPNPEPVVQQIGR